MSGIWKWIDRFYENISVIVYALAVVVMFAQVVMRYVFDTPMMWAEEFSRIMFVWIVYMGAPIVIIRHANIEVDYFVQFLPHNFRRYLKVTLYLFAFVFLLYVAWLGAVLSTEHIDMEAYTIPISQSFWYLPIAFGFFMMAINMVKVVIGILTGTDSDEELEKSEGVL